jgi:hypothetical protein
MQLGSLAAVESPLCISSASPLPVSDNNRRRSYDMSLLTHGLGSTHACRVHPGQSITWVMLWQGGVEHVCTVRVLGTAAGRWFFGFAFLLFVENAAWKTLVVLERRLLARPYITSGEKGQVWGCWGLLGG